MHVTWGAGGSTQERSLELAGASQGMGLETCLHLTCTNMGKKMVDEALKVSLLTAYSILLSWLTLDSLSEM